MSPLEVVLVGGECRRSRTVAIVDEFLVSNDRTTSIEFQELRILDYNLAPHVVQLYETVEVVRGLVEYHALYNS